MQVRAFALVAASATLLSCRGADGSGVPLHESTLKSADHVHYEGDLEAAEHVPHDTLALDHTELHHYVVTFARGRGPSSVTELSAALGSASSHPHVVPVRSYMVWASLSDVYAVEQSRGWSVRYVRLVERKHKNSYLRVNTAEPDAAAAEKLAGGVFVFAAHDRRQDWVQRLRAQGMVLAKRGIVRVGGLKYLAHLESTRDVRAAVSALSRCPEVRWVEPQLHAEPLNNVGSCTVQTDNGLTHPLWDALESPLTGKGEVVLIGDTGVNIDSCFFKDARVPVAFWPEVNAKHRKIISYIECVDESTGDHDHRDLLGHGTHVAGSLMGYVESPTGSTEETMAKYGGLARDAKMIFADLNCGSSGLTKLAVPLDLLLYFNQTIPHGVRVSHNSWGYEKPRNYVSIDRETDEHSWRYLDFLVVVAAGNSPGAGILSPAASKNVLTVGAHKNSADVRARDMVAPFAKGPNFDGRVKPEVMAPGYDSVSSAHHTSQCATRQLSGTSMAAPWVSAAATVIRQYFKEGWYPSGKKGLGRPLDPTSALVKAMVTHSARKMHHTTGFPQMGLPNNHQGFGMMALQDVLYFNGNNANANQYRETHLLAKDKLIIKQDETVVIEFDVGVANVNTRATDVKVTLVYTDYPAAFGAHRATVNDLDLVVVAPDGTLHYANQGQDVARVGDSKYDRTNLIEQVTIPAKAVVHGRYRALVYGYHIVEHEPYPGQPFAFVATAPQLQVPNSATPVVACPHGCSGRGTCNAATGLCACREGFHHVDCALCDAEVFCNNNGVCGEADGKATCTCNGGFAGEHCDECKPGFFGPNCDLDCTCSGHGICPEGPVRERACKCEGNWDGAHCATCARGWSDDKNNCETPAHWCPVDTTHTKRVTGERTGLLQINSWGHYKNSRHCLWAVMAPSAAWDVRFDLEEFNIEKTYDHLAIYEGAEEDIGHHIAMYDGEDGKGKSHTIAGKGAGLVAFRADLIGPGVGFKIRFTLTGDCTSEMCGANGVCAKDTDRFTCSCEDGYDPVTLCTTCQAGHTGPNCRAAATTPAPTSVPATQPGDTHVPTTVAPPVNPAKPCSVPGRSVCSSHGVCKATGCDCEPGYVGDVCEIACPGLSLTPHTTCANNGLCKVDPLDPDKGVCKCQSGTWGVACQLVSAPAPAPIDEFTLQKVLPGRLNVFMLGDLADTASSAVRIRISSREPADSADELTVFVYNHPARVGLAGAELVGGAAGRGEHFCHVVGWTGEIVLGITTTSKKASTLALIEVDVVPVTGATPPEGASPKPTLRECTAEPFGLQAVETLEQRWAATASPSPPSLEFAGPFIKYTVLGFIVALCLTCGCVVWKRQRRIKREAADRIFAKRQRAQEEGHEDFA